MIKGRLVGLWIEHPNPQLKFPADSNSYKTQHGKRYGQELANPVQGRIHLPRIQRERSRPGDMGRRQNGEAVASTLSPFARELIFNLIHSELHR